MINWLKTVDDAIERAANSKKLILVDFFSPT